MALFRNLGVNLRVALCDLPQYVYGYQITVGLPQFLDLDQWENSILSDQTARLMH
jgi:hypothetical protein